MPELPEVETLRRELSRAVVGRRIKAAKISWPKMVRPLSSAGFNRALAGQKIIAVARRAKILIVKLSGGAALLIHLKLTGQLIFKPRRGKMVVGGHPEDPTKYTRAILHFTDGSRLFFNDLRKFGWLKIASREELAKLSSETGAEPLDRHFTFETFNQLLKRFPRRKIKPLLMDQSLIAGLGNIYADESCFAAGLRPTRRAQNTSRAERQKLYHAIKKILLLAISKKGTSADTYRQLDGSPGGFVPHLKVYGRKGQPCRRCGRPIQKIKLAGRGTHYCPRCQK